MRRGTLHAVVALAVAAVALDAAAAEWAHPAFTERLEIELSCPRPQPLSNTAYLPKSILPPPEAAEIALPSELAAAAAAPVVYLTDPRGKRIPSSLRYDEALRRWVLAFSAAVGKCHVYVKPDGELGLKDMPYLFKRRGLFLATYDITKSTSDGGRGNTSMDTFVQEGRAGLPTFGSGPRRLIDDAENPFGPNDHYLSIYQGWLLVEKAGKHRFAIDCDDGGFVLVDGAMAASWYGRSHTMAGNWQRNSSRRLEAGLHHMAVYQRERMGAQGVRVAWRLPDDGREDGAFGIIPPRAFPGAVPARVTRRLSIGGEELVHVAAVPVAQYVTPQGKRIAAVRLDAIGAPPGAIDWEVRGGASASGGGAIVHLPAGVDVPVSLRHGGGSETRSVSVPLWHDAESIDISIRLRELAPFAFDDEAMRIGLEVVNSSSRLHRVSFNSSLPGERPRVFGLAARLPREKRRVPGRVREIDLHVPAGRIPHGGKIKLHAGLPGVKLDQATVLVLGSRDEWPRLTARIDGLAGPGGERVALLVPRELESDYRRWAPLRAAAGAIARRAGGVLVYGDDMTGPGRTGLTAGLAETMGESVELRHAAFGRGDIPALAAVAGVDGAAGEERACVISLGRGDGSVQTPLHVFERSIDVVIDRLRRAGATKIVLVGPLPEVGRLRHSRRYSAAAKRIAAEHHVAYVDLHELLASSRDWRQNFSRGDGAGLTGPYPSPKALATVAAAVAREL